MLTSRSGLTDFVTIPYPYFPHFVMYLYVPVLTRTSWTSVGSYLPDSDPTDFYLGSIVLNIVLHFRRLFPGVSINVCHIEAQQDYQLGCDCFSIEDWDSMELFMSLQPSDRRAAIRMRLVVYLLDVLPEVTSSGAIPHGKLPRLASKAADTILRGMKTDGEDLKELICYFLDRSALLRKTAPLIHQILKEFMTDNQSEATPSTSARGRASNSAHYGISSGSNGARVYLLSGLVTVVADVLLDLAPSISPSSLPVIAGKVADDILSGGASFDAVPSRSEVLSLVRARMGMIKGLIKEGRQPLAPPSSLVDPSGGGGSAGVISAATDAMPIEEVRANLRRRLPLLLPELVPELKVCCRGW